MKVAVVLLEECDKVNLYSVEILDEEGDEQLSEFQKFCVKMSNTSDGGRNSRQLEEIQGIIDDIAFQTGATEETFREEDGFQAIPSHDDKDRFYDSDGEDHWGLRLYCLRINDEILILLNGCSKTAQNPRNCEDCRPHFDFARKFTISFLNALRIEHRISVEDRLILADDEEIDIIINV